MKKNLENKKGITLITLVVAVSIMIIISGLLIYNARTGIKVRSFNMMKNDIDLLEDKVSAYYMEYGALPVEIKYNVNPLPFESVKNPNDSTDGYYVLDLKAFEGLTLNYGTDYDKVTEDTVADYNDLYVINEQSHQIYYVRGIEMDGVIYYTNDISEQVSLIEKKWIDGTEIVGDNIGIYGVDNKGDVYLISDTYSGKPNNSLQESVFQSKIIKISSNFDNTAAIDEQGKVYIWGANEDGQLGNGTIGYDLSSNIPICISNITNNLLNGKKIIDISVGNSFIIALDNNGKIYTWGANYQGQLGNGSEEDSSLPICISDIDGNLLNNKNIVKISNADSYTVALDDDGKVYTWGVNSNGQLGNGTSGYDYGSTVPVCISNIPNNPLNGKTIVSISAKNNFTMALDNEGKIYTWGSNYSGQLGNGSTENSDLPICISNIGDNILNGKNIVNVFSCDSLSAALDNQGKVYVWGSNTYGELGNGTNEESLVPICISDISNHLLNDKKIIKISGGTNYTVALDSSGKVYTWGSNRYGQLGIGTTQNSYAPICLNNIIEGELKDKKIIDISTGRRHTVVLDDQGNVYTWGNNMSGQLGNIVSGPGTPTPICINSLENIILEGKHIVDISGSSYIVALSNQGKIYTWGGNQYGQLGNGSTNNSTIPACISDIDESILKDKNIVQISTGGMHVIALDDQGKVYAWGNNRYGQLGNASTEDSSLPVCISDMSGNILKDKKIVQISAGVAHTAVVDNQGKVYTWGADLTEFDISGRKYY